MRLCKRITYVPLRPSPLLAPPPQTPNGEAEIHGVCLFPWPLSPYLTRHVALQSACLCPRLHGVLLQPCQLRPVLPRHASHQAPDYKPNFSLKMEIR